MKLPTLLGILERAILAAPGAIGDVTIAVSVARDLRAEVMNLAMKVASSDKHRERLERSIVHLQRSNDSYELAFELLETSLNNEIKRQAIYAEQLKNQLDFTAQADAAEQLEDRADEDASIEGRGA